MIYISSFLLGIFCIFSWSIFYYLIKPNAFFLTVNQKVLSRWNILLYWLVFTLIIFILVCLFIPTEKTAPSLNSLFLGVVAAFIGLFYSHKNKFNINKNKKASEQFKEQKIDDKPNVEFQQDIESDTQKIEQFHSEGPIESKNIESILHRYELDYKDRFGNVTTRFIDVIAVQKEWGNNRWYFTADTEEGERTFRSERVISLKDSWTGEVFNTSKTIREYLVKNYPETDDAFDG